MKKLVRYDKNAIKELESFDLKVQADLLSMTKILSTEGKLEYPQGKKLTKDIFEIRIKTDGVYRGFYAYIYDKNIIILHFFKKKSQKTPLKNLKLAEKRLKKYE